MVNYDEPIELLGMSMSERLSTIELYKEDMKFVAGHYTIFSATERERLHGHTFNLYAAITTEINANGLTFDYHYYKEKLRHHCRELNEYFLLAGNSPYQQVEEQGDNIYVHYSDEVIPFLKKDVKILPIRNTTVEELSYWFLNQLIQNPEHLTEQKIQHILIKVFSGPGQSGSAEWGISHPK